MGCASSKLDDLPAVALCRERCAFLDEAIRHRYELAQAHFIYMESLRGVGHSLREFLSHAGAAAPGTPVLNLPPQKKGDHAVAAFANSPSKGSNSGHHLPFHSDSEDDSLSDELHYPSDPSSPLPGKEGHYIRYVNSDQGRPGMDMGMGMGMSSYPGMGMSSYPGMSMGMDMGSGSGSGSYQSGFMNMNFMKSKATPSLVYQQKPVTSETVYTGESSSSNYFPYPTSNVAPYPYHDHNIPGYGSSVGGYYGSQTNYGSSSPLQRHAEEKPPPPPPPPDQGSAWDFLRLFDTTEKFYHAYTPSRNSKELREEEGIPDLEDEHEVVKEVHGNPKFVDGGNHLKSVAVDGDDDEEEGGKVDGGASTSMYQARPSVSIDNANDGAEYDVHVVEKKVVDGEGRSDEGGNASRFKGIGSVSELVREIEAQFERAAESGREIAKMLEVGKVPYKRKSQVSSRKAHGRTPSFSVVSAQPPSSGGAEPSASAENGGPASLGFVEEMGMRSGNLSSTLHKLHLWEKKLYNEVKNEEKTRVVHDRKVQKLKHLSERGADTLKVEPTRIMIRNLSTKIRIAIQVVDKISVTINKIRDEELWPQISELIEGLMRMWKCLLECHRNQCLAMKEAQNFGLIGSARKLGDASADTILQFQHELINWANRFTTWVTAQKDYVKALNNWLLKCLFYEPEETPDGIVPFSPGRIGAPPIFVICHQWSQAMDGISEKEVVTAMFVFTSSVSQLRERDKTGMHPRMVATANKDSERVARDLDREDQKIQKEIQALEKKIIRGSGNGHVPSVTGRSVYQSDVSNDLQANLQRVFEAMERYTENSMRAYEELMQRSEEEIRIAQERVRVS
ncbi:hypothetical protein BT93_I1152 [Corymbia citriodora subsp. variegata]|nr:hypothetical protein BT93_I1152 [Corymbia citriodora subsp. variegata]